MGYKNLVFVGLKRLLTGSILTGRHAEPTQASLVKTAVVVEAEQVGHVLHIEMGMAQIEVCQLLTHMVQDIRELRACLL